MFIFLDTETTGTGPDDRLCQIAFKPDNGPIASGLFNPGKPISVDAMVVHHITDKMVRDKPPFKGSDLHARLKAMASDADKVIVAHNAQYDMNNFTGGGYSLPTGDLQPQAGPAPGQKRGHSQV
jgi:exodeoxyribonuclease X